MQQSLILRICPDVSNYIASSGIEIVAELDAIMQVKYFAVGFAVGRFAYGIAHRLSATCAKRRHANIHRVAAVKHSASRGNVYRASHQENMGLNLSSRLVLPFSSVDRSLNLPRSYRYNNVAEKTPKVTENP